MARATLTSKGGITLPKAIRERLGVSAGVLVDFAINQRGDVVARAVNHDVEELKGLLKRRRQRGTDERGDPG